MRPIDADELLDRAICTRNYFEIKSLVERMPTITQPPHNDPLTLDELREMDGDPVWVERPGYGKHWALVQVWAKSTNIIYLTCSNGMVLHPKPEIDGGAKLYRRKPESKA